jgi:SAM-dependent methyltransferase
VDTNKQDGGLLASLFSRLTWDADRQPRIGDVVFDLQHLGQARDSSERGFVLYKEPSYIRTYADWWPAGFAPRHVLELGLWAGGSVAFWTELLRPERFLGVDLVRADAIGAGNLARLQRYQAEHPEVRLYWETNQSNRMALRQIVSTECPDGLDLVIDDASHWYHPTRISFETIFPVVRPGGWYVIEDWPWDLGPPSAWQAEWRRAGGPLSRLIAELVLFAGRNSKAMTAFVVRGTFAAVQRGPAALPSNFSLLDHLPPPRLGDALGVVRRMAGHALRRWRQR